MKTLIIPLIILLISSISHGQNNEVVIGNHYKIELNSDYKNCPELLNNQRQLNSSEGLEEFRRFQQQTLITYIGKDSILLDYVLEYNDWDEDVNDWVNEWDYLYQYTYDDKYYLISQAGYKWGHGSNGWSYGDAWIWFWEYAYDDYGHLIKETYSYYLGEDYDSKTEYAYDESGHQLSRVYYRWNSETDVWTGDWKSEYAYDENGYQIVHIEYEGYSDTTGWIPYWKTESVFDAYGNRSSYIEYRWYNEWALHYRYEYHYDENGIEVSSIGYRWNNGWDLERKFENNYDEHGNLISWVSSEWDSGTNNWIGDWKYEYACDAHGNRISALSYHWDSETNVWITGSWKYEYAYDEIGNLISELRYRWNSETGNWLGHWKRELYSSSHTQPSSNTNYDENLSQVRMYPNPANTFLNIETSYQGQHSIEITSLNGQLLKCQKAEGSTHRIDLSSLREGLYLLKIENAEYTVIKKVIKK